MFISSARHKKLVNLLAEELRDLLKEYRALHNEWNALVSRINAHGGEALFSRDKSAPQLSKEDIQSLIQLVHPDKHDGKESALRMTQKLLKLRNSP